MRRFLRWLLRMTLHPGFKERAAPPELARSRIDYQKARKRVNGALAELDRTESLRKH